MLNFDWSDFLNEKSMATCLSCESDHFDRPVLSEILVGHIRTHISPKRSDSGDYSPGMPHHQGEFWGPKNKSVRPRNKFVLGPADLHLKHPDLFLVILLFNSPICFDRCLSLSLGVFCSLSADEIAETAEK